MNEKQRDYLVKQVRATYNSQREELEEHEPEPPSLNNYLVAACLDGSMQLQDVEGIKNKIRQRVLDFGVEDRLVQENDGYSRRRRKEKESNIIVTLPAEELFVFPQGYLDAVEKYKEEKIEYDRKMRDLDAQVKTLEMKITVGSNESLDKLIPQIDNMADLNILNNQLKLDAPDRRKKEK